MIVSISVTIRKKNSTCTGKERTSQETMNTFLFKKITIVISNFTKHIERKFEQREGPQ